MTNDSLGDRMKNYEQTTQTRLLRRTPVIIRVDGKAFHTYTKKFSPLNDPSLGNGPFSHVLHTLMTNTASAMLFQTQNAIFAYTQSDEISILLKDWTKIKTCQWFDGNVQKITSIAGAMASAYFNYFNYFLSNMKKESDLIPNGVQQVPLFDARVFNLPKEEVVNYFIWRQQDASRNSINMLARFYFSHKELHGKSTSELQDMLMLQHSVNWNDLETWKKRGTAVVPNPNIYSSDSPNIIDEEIPIFTQDRSYIEQHLHEEEE